MEISIQEFKNRAYELIRSLKEPFILTSRGKKVAIVSSYSPEEEMYQEAVAGRITWDDYREKLLKKGFAQLEKHPEKISPSHVISAEGIEVAKTKTRLEEVGLRLAAAKFFTKLLPTKCPKCKTPFLPEGGLKIDDKYLRPQLTDSRAEKHRAVRKALPGS